MDPGLRLCVAEHKLTDKYLADEIAGRPVVAEFINHADVYSAVPDELVSGLRCVRDRDGHDAWYIISSVRFAGRKKNRKLRTIDGDPAKSYWHSEKGKIPVEGSGIGGYVQDCVQATKGTGGRHERTGWRMKEYGLSTAEHGDSAVVLCKVYRTPRERDHSTASTSTTIINAEKRKAADGDYADEEDSRPSVRPRLAEEHPPPIALRPEPERSGVDQQFRTHFHPMEDLEGYFARKALQEINASSRQEMAAQPEPEMDESFVQSMEQEFPFSNEVVIEEAAPPWEAAAQPEEEEEDAATGLVKTMAADDQMDAISSNEEGAQPEPEWDMQQEFPFLYPSHKNDSDEEEAAQPGPPEAQPEEEDAATGLLETIAADAQMDASLGEEGVHPEPEPDEPAPDEVIYGLPCPAFSPEMILRCSDDVLTPWPSPSSMSMIFDCLY